MPYNSKLPISGDISLTTIQDEFGGNNPIGMSEYYRGGAYVPDLTPNSSIPVTAGQPNKSSFFYGGAKSLTGIIKSITYTSPGTYTVIVPTGATSVTLIAAGGGGAGAPGGQFQGIFQYGWGTGGASSAVATLSNYTNITAGQVLTVVVGAGGSPLGWVSSLGGQVNPGNPSYVEFQSSNQKLVYSSGGGGGVTGERNSVPSASAAGTGYDILGNNFVGAVGGLYNSGGAYYVGGGAGGSNSLASGGAFNTGSRNGSGGAGYSNGSLGAGTGGSSGAGGTGGVSITFNDVKSTYSTPGTYTFTVPIGCTSIVVEAWGGGGGAGPRAYG